jgi:hypothetical protein
MRGAGLFALTFLAMASVAWAQDLDAMRQRIAANTPDYPAPLYDVFDAAGQGAIPVRLLGIDIVQNAQPLTGVPAELDGAKPLTIAAYWEATVRVTSSVPLKIAFWDRLCLISPSEDLRIGPRNNEEPWQPGNVYRQEYPVDVRAVANAFSGHGYLLLSLRSMPGRSRDLTSLQMVPVLVHPLIEEIKVSERSLERVVPPPYRIIPSEFRLGQGAEVRLDVPADWRAGNRRLAVMSSMSYQSLPEGAAACEIALTLGVETKAKFELDYGVHTARCDDEPRAGGATVFESRDSAHLNREGRPVQLHKYIAVFDLPVEAASIDAIAFHCNAEVVLDIFGMALLPGE